MTDFAHLSTKTVFVIGSASGLGRGVAELAAVAGARVVVFDVSPCDVGAYVRVDLRDPASIRQALRAVDEPFDLLLNSAGLPPGADPASILQVNYLGQTQLVERLLSKASIGARVVTIASIAGREWRKSLKAIAALRALPDLTAAPAFCDAHGIDGKAAYRLSKAAFIHWTRAMSAAHPGNDVTFLSVSPGPVNTELFRQAALKSPDATADLRAAAPRIAEPEEVARAILGLSRPEFVWLNGINIPLDGGADARFDALGLNMNVDFKVMAREQ